MCLIRRCYWLSNEGNRQIQEARTGQDRGPYTFNFSADRPSLSAGALFRMRVLPTMYLANWILSCRFRAAKNTIERLIQPHLAGGLGGHQKGNPFLLLLV